MAMYADLRPGDAVQIGGSRITIEHKTGGRSRLRIDSGEDIQIHRAGEAAQAAAPRAGQVAAAPAVPRLPLR